MNRPETTRPFTTYRRLFGYVKPYRAAFALGMFGALVYAAAMASFAYFAGRFTNYVLVHADGRTVIWLPIAVVGVLLVRSTGDFTQTYFTGYVGRRVVANLRQQVFAAVNRLPINYFDRNASGTLLSRITFNVEQVSATTTDSTVMLVRSLLQMCLTLGYAMTLNFRLTIMALVMAPLVGWLVSRINRYFRRYSRRIQDSMGDVSRVAKESFECTSADQDL